MVAKVQWASVGWAPRGGYQGEGPTEMGTRKWAPRGGPQGLGPRMWVPGCGLQVGAAQGVYPLGERNGCGPHVVGPRRVGSSARPSGVGWCGPKDVGTRV